MGHKDTSKSIAATITRSPEIRWEGRERDPAKGFSPMLYEIGVHFHGVYYYEYSVIKIY